MFRSRSVIRLALVALLAVPAPLFAKSNVHTYWYQPHYMASVEDASNRLQFLAPHFAPVGSRPATTDYTLTNLSLNKLGINLSYNESGVNQVPQGLLGLTSISVPYTKESVFSIVYAGIEFIEIRNFTAGSVAPWCAIPMGKDSGNGIICVSNREDAERVADALATLAVAYGKNLNTSFSMAIGVMTDKEQRKHPGQTGCMVREVDENGPAAQAGIQEDDIVHAINGLPCSLQTFSAALTEAIAKPQGGVVHAEILRKSGPLTVDLHFPHSEVPAAQLRRQVANPAQQYEPTPSATPTPAAPPSSVHFGFQVRPVIKDDMAPLMLTKAEGLVVVSVENGGLADTMGVLAGDVILQVNGEQVSDINHFVQTIRSGAARSFRVWRKGQTIELSVPQSL
jgi:hypothetical protein